DVLVRVTVENAGPEAAELHALPTLWFRNTWSWGRSGEGYWPKPSLRLHGPGQVLAEHAALGRFLWAAAPGPDGAPPRLAFTENETNSQRLYGVPNAAPCVKDAFHDWLVGGREDALSPEAAGTKAAAHYRLSVPAGGSATLRLRLRAEAEGRTLPFSEEFDEVFALRRAEADAFHSARCPETATPEERRVARQAFAGLVWNRQFYNYVVADWQDGDPGQPPPPEGHRASRNEGWRHLYARDVISMPDDWEYPWFAAWDLAFQAVAAAPYDPAFAKEQLLLLLHEWYMHPNGQLPAYEFAFGDVNPPVHAWAAWNVYKATGRKDRLFLERVFQKLLFNFGWWVNRKDLEGDNLFGGGFLGLDNIGVFDRTAMSASGRLEQADATAWMAFFCLTMLAISLELAAGDGAYEDVASKFFEHFTAIADAVNGVGGPGLWDEADGFYYDRLRCGGAEMPLRLRSLVGLMPLLAVETLDDAVVARLPGFKRRLEWFLEHRADSARALGAFEPHAGGLRLLSVASRERLIRVLARLLDEREFLSPFGVRSLSKVYGEAPYAVELDGRRLEVRYAPGESDTGMFGGNSNWRGPVWFPVNYLLREALERTHRFYGESLRVECPAGSGRLATLGEAARELDRRLLAPFLPGPGDLRPFQGGRALWAGPRWREHLLFNEYFHGDTGRGCGASHQTGWTALAGLCALSLARSRSA
ncbi:MAG: glucosidase, partial [Elusimicrobia bacterium]|nr:glucosidase [Elusimicrobiota bacterium]